ncbi:MFS transporter [Amycolatopsis roodepoortensis]|uniref:MFS transporter n=1 Tax=Amycolatopsis roodepoortensis TaxID=700274 RepID=UPI00214B5C05|nr:MFS transporter [Amycolatopsis roodepoortensis]UUV35866.1 MFS transporter [Amycolatopsis roodepoortensis]
MKDLISKFGSFDRPSQLLMVNQFSINLGFYMLMPYLAGHLSADLALAGWAVGLILGVRNFSQQGMFLIGGTLADRLGYKPLIVAGCALRTAGFVLLGLVDSVPALIIASAATGFAGALFNPAVRAYLAKDAGEERRVEAFALFNVFYQAGILLGPVVGLVLTSLAFQMTCLVAAAVFAGLTVLQIRSLPARSSGTGEKTARTSIRQDWSTAFGNRSFLLFSFAMIGSYVLSFQIYLALPLEARRVGGPGVAGTALVAALFAVSGGLAIAGQLRITAWCRQRWGRGRCITIGLLFMGAAFVPPMLTAGATSAAFGWASLLLSAALLAIGTIVVFPFEMDTIITLSGGKLVATHYGLYNTVVGVGILLGNLVTGTALDVARNAGAPAAPWGVLAVLGAGCAWCLYALDKAEHLTPAVSAKA